MRGMRGRCDYFVLGRGENSIFNPNPVEYLIFCESGKEPRYYKMYYNCFDTMIPVWLCSPNYVFYINAFYAYLYIAYAPVKYGRRYYAARLFM